MKKVLKKFGKYLLLDRLAQGGMAEIFRAWAPSVDGGGRLIALKCVQPDFGEDPEFLQMFRSEIRVTMGLNHPNIVQLYDFGEFEGRPFIAMEFVEGKNLKQFTTRVFQKGPMQPEYAAHLIQQAAAGLHYAHSYKDRSSGQALNIVHRDVSPQNLLLSYGGNLKIIDFGIAKAASNRQATRAGIIKGKPSYLSPEQIDGLELDGRSDIFSLGAVLWETLAGKKLFSGDTELSAVHMIEEADRSVKAPSTLNGTVPPELDAIVMKALARDRANRFKTAEELQRALHRFIYSHRPDFDPAEFGLFVQGVFKTEMEQEQEAIRSLTAEARAMLAEPGGPQGQEAAHDGREARDAQDAQDAEASRVSPRDGKFKTFAALSLESVEIDVPNDETRPRKKRDLSHFDNSKSDRYATRRKGPSASGRLLSFAVVVGLIASGLAYVLPLLRERFQQQSQAQPARASASEQASADSASAPAGAPLRAAQAPVKLRIFPSGGPVQVLIDQKPVSPEAPGLSVPVGTTAKLEIRKNGFEPFEQDITAISATEPVRIDAVLEPVTYGTLSLHTTPTAEARISTGDQLWLQSTPLEQLKLPPGTYQIQLVNQLLGMSKTLQLSIEANRNVNRDVNLDVVK